MGRLAVMGGWCCAAASVLLSLPFVSLNAPPSAAASFTVQEGRDFKIVILRGRIVPDDPAELRRVLSRTPGVGEVWLDSPGGTLGAGISMGQIIREKGLATRVQARGSCASACFHAFVGGVVRVVDPGGLIGLHMATLTGNTAYMNGLRDLLLNERGLTISKRIELITMFSEQSAAIAAGRQAVHVVGMGVSPAVLDRVFQTHHLDIYWLSQQEMRGFNVTNSLPAAR